jgi:aquaporin Z
MRSEKVANGQLRRLGPAMSLRRHWPEYLMEAAALGIFMVSAGVFTTLFDLPGSPFISAFPSPLARRALVGVAMGTTAMGLIYSPWGRRSGAHMNPAITLTFLSLGKIPRWDALYYCVFQCLGGLAGVFLTAAALGPWFTDPPVDFVVTVPGPAGDLKAFIAEASISMIMMGMIVWVSNRKPLAPFTGILAGILIFVFVSFESPISGFGMNPARTLASALPSNTWTAFWIYAAAPLLGMGLAAQCYVATKGVESVHCCKLHHRTTRPCIFCGRSVVPMV